MGARGRGRHTVRGRAAPWPEGGGGGRYGGARREGRGARGGWCGGGGARREAAVRRRPVAGAGRDGGDGGGHWRRPPTLPQGPTEVRAVRATPWWPPATACSDGVSRGRRERRRGRAASLQPPSFALPSRQARERRAPPARPWKRQVRASAAGGRSFYRRRSSARSPAQPPARAAHTRHNQRCPALRVPVLQRGTGRNKVSHSCLMACLRCHVQVTSGVASAVRSAHRNLKPVAGEMTARISSNCGQCKEPLRVTPHGPADVPWPPQDFVYTEPVADEHDEFAVQHPADALMQTDGKKNWSIKRTLSRLRGPT